MLAMFAPATSPGEAVPVPPCATAKGLVRVNVPTLRTVNVDADALVQDCFAVYVIVESVSATSDGKSAAAMILLVKFDPEESIKACGVPPKFGT